MILPQYVGAPSTDPEAGQRQYSDEMARRAAAEKAAQDAANLQKQSDFSKGPESGMGNLGFQIGGGQNQYYDPRIAFQTPFQGGYLDVYKDFNAETNPGAYLYNPSKLTPTKTTYENQDHLWPIPKSLGGGQATQTIGGQNYNVNGNNYAAGSSTATARPFQASQGDARYEAQTPFTGFGFGQEGQPGYKFMSGQMSSLTPGTSSQFYADQPQSLNPTPNPTLGTFQPWQDPALKALKESRSAK